MSFLLPLVAGCALLPGAEPEKPASLHYVRPEKGKYVDAADVTAMHSEDGSVVTIRAAAPDKMTVTLHLDKAGQVTDAEAMQSARKGVTLKPSEKGTWIMKRGGITDFVKDLPANPVIVAGPDWADVLQVLRRYGAAKGGKQEFAGVSIDPIRGLEKQTFTAERKGTDTVKVKDKEIKLDRFRLKVRGGDTTAWADGEGRVVRVQGLAAKALPVILEGFEDATRELKP